MKNMEHGTELGTAAAVGGMLEKWDPFPNHGKHCGFRGYEHWAVVSYDGVKSAAVSLFPLFAPSVKTHNSTAQDDVKNVIQIMMSGARG